MLVCVSLYGGTIRTPAAAAGPRFKDNRDGTVTDTRTGRVWLKRASCLEERTTSEIHWELQHLAAGRCGLCDGSSPGDWRLPDRDELQSLLDPGNFSPVLPPGHPFSQVPDGCYWLQPAKPGAADGFDIMYIGLGGAGLGGMNACAIRSQSRSPVRFYVWPLRNRTGARSGAAPGSTATSPPLSR